LPIDPADIGRTYEPLVRINSQSGKGGIAFVLERTHGYRVPRGLAVEFGQIVQRIADATGTELPFESVCEVFEREYLGESSPFVSLKRCDVRRERENACSCEATVVRSGVEKVIRGCGQGPVEAFVKAVNYGYDVELHCVDYAEHALAKGNDAMAVAYVGLSDNGHVLYGVGKARDITMASLRAVLSATNRLMTARRVASGVRVTTL
jgi:2-isopropylmalate synthase